MVAATTYCGYKLLLGYRMRECRSHMRLLVFSSNSWSDKICQLPEVGGATNKKADAFCAVGFRSLPAIDWVGPLVFE